MNEKKLNVVYIGPQSFPLGGATTKRRRYMVDYMNNHGIQSHYLVCDFKQRGKRPNASSGTYGICDYYDITPLATSKKYFKFWREGKRILKQWHNEGEQNILLFSTVLSPFEYPFYTYGKKLGYKIVFDQVETSYLLSGSTRFMHRFNQRITEYLSSLAYKHSSAFVISKNLWNENHERYPYRKLCLLPNSTPQLCLTYRTKLNKPLKILYSGTYAPKDGVEYLLNGVIEAHDMGCDIELYLLGKGEKKDMRVLNIVQGKDYVHYLGFVSDEELAYRLSDCDLLCMTRCNSRFANYGFPFKLSEYLATGNIVLATNVGDVSDYIENDKSAYIIPSEDSHAIAQAIRYVIDNPQKALNVAKGGLTAMQQHFSIEKVGSIFVDFLHLL